MLMDGVNDTLLLSLKQEIKTLNEVVCNISQLCGESSEIRSWIFPTKSYQVVGQLITDGYVADFKSCLEIIVDRLYVAIRLILEYLDTRTTTEKSNPLIRRPKQLTLGYTFQALWTSVSTTLTENMDKNTKDDKTKTTTKDEDNTVVNIVNKETQTDIIALNRCDSCSSAMLCMKNLLQSFEHEQFKGGRQVLRPKIYDITQFGCMLQTTTTIEDSLSTLFEKLFAKEQENEVLLNENKKLKEEISNRLGKITLLEKEVNIFKEKYEKDTFKITLLSSQNQDLLQTKSKYEFQMKTLEEIINNLNKSIYCYKQKIETYMLQKECTQKALKKYSDKQRKIINFSLALEKKSLRIETEYVCIEEILKETDHVIDNINNRANIIRDTYSEIKNKIEKINKSLRNNSCFIVSKWQHFQKNLKQHMVNTSIYKSKAVVNQDVNSFQVRGNPLEDLTRQIEENTEKINLLQTENAKLETVVKKLSVIRI